MAEKRKKTVREHPFWGFGRKIKEYPITTAISSKDEGYGDAVSRYNDKNSRIVLVSPLIKAVMMEEYAVFSAGMNLTGAVCRSSSRPEIMTIALYSTSGNVKAGAYNSDEKSWLPYNVYKNIDISRKDKVFNSDGKVIWLAMLPELEIDTEFRLARKTIQEMHKFTENEIRTAMYRMSDNIYQRANKGMVIISTEDGMEDAYPLFKENEFSYSSAYCIEGSNSLSATAISLLSEITTESTEESPSTEGSPIETASSMTYETAREKYDLGFIPSKEQAFFMRNPSNGYVVSKPAKKMCENIKNMHGDSEAMKNFLLEGMPGSGKSADAVFVSFATGLPFYELGCSAGTTEEDICGCIYPKLGDETKAVEIPDVLEIIDDPVKSYKKITGEDNDTITVEECLACALGEATKTDVNKDGVTYVYKPSPLTLAFKYGGILEIQEPSSVASSAVLSILNSIMNGDEDGVLQTPAGPIKRHPECYVIATTNPDTDGGYRKMNEAVRSRFNQVMAVNLPSAQEMVERAMSKTGFSDKTKLMQMAIIITNIEATCKEKGIQGTAGLRGLYDWCKLIHRLGYSFEEAFNDAVLNKVTTNKEEQQVIKDSIKSVYSGKL